MKSLKLVNAEINFVFVGAAFCRPQACMTDIDGGLIQARAAGCRPYEDKVVPQAHYKRVNDFVEGFVDSKTVTFPVLALSSKPDIRRIQ